MLRSQHFAAPLGREDQMRVQHEDDVTTCSQFHRPTSIDQLDKSAIDPNINARIGTEDQDKLYKTFSYRVKDATSGKRLVALGNAVNTVWNYCNEVSAKSAERGPKWITKSQLRDLTKGASRELDLPSQVMQEVIDEFIIKRRTHGRPKLRWRVSRGARRSLGWIPFTNQDVAIEGSLVFLRGQKLRLWKHREIVGRIKSGSFSQDARGRWYCNIVMPIPRLSSAARAFLAD